MTSSPRTSTWAVAAKLDKHISNMLILKVTAQLILSTQLKKLNRILTLGLVRAPEKLKAIPIHNLRLLTIHSHSRPPRLNLKLKRLSLILSRRRFGSWEVLSLRDSMANNTTYSFIKDLTNLKLTRVKIWTHLLDQIT